MIMGLIHQTEEHINVHQRSGIPHTVNIHMQVRELEIQSNQGLEDNAFCVGENLI